jgi:hypothetical protein
MELEAARRARMTVGVAIDELGQLIDAIDQTTDLLERSYLFRRLRVAAETLGVLRAGFSLPSAR